MSMIALDTECTGLDFNHGALPYFITIYDESGEHTNYDWVVDPYTRKPTIPQSDVEEIKHLVQIQKNWGDDKYSKDISNRHTLILQNCKFDITALSHIDPWFRANWPWKQTRDTIIAGHLLDSGSPHNLTDMVMQYLNENIQPYEDKIEKATQWCRRYARRKFPDWEIAAEGQESMPSAKASKSAKSDGLWKADMWLPKLMVDELGYDKLASELDNPDHNYDTLLRDYANADSFFTYHLWQAMETLLHERDLWEIFESRMKLLPVAFKMEHRGVTLSKKRLLKLQDEYEKETDKCETICVNIASNFKDDDNQPIELKLPKSGNNKQLTDLIFNRMKLPISKTTKETKNGGGGNPSLDAEVLDDYVLSLPHKSQELLFIKNLVAMRKRKTALNYIEGYQRHWVPLKGGDDEEWYKLHSNLNPVGTAHLRWSCSNPNCVDGDTELLTSDGWVKASEITTEHKVAQYWARTEQINFVTPQLQKHIYNGNMLHIATEEQIDMLVTPNHRCLLENRKTGEKRVVKAANFMGDFKQFNAGNYVGGEVTLSENEVILLCATQADGSYVTVDNKEYGISFAFRKRRKIDRLEKCFQGLEIEYTKAIRNKATWFYLKYDSEAVKFIKSYMPNKIFGKWLLDFNRDTLDIFKQEVIFWDGNFVGQSGYTSSIKDNTDWVQILWTLSNWRVSSITKIPNQDRGNIKEHHYLNLTRKQNYSLTSNFIRNIVKWNDYVYCVTVPSSFIIIRRNGKVAITGNSTNISKKEGFNLRQMFGPAEGREWWSLDAQNIELRIPAFEAGEKDLIDVFLNPTKEPYYGSYHLVVFDTLHPELFKKHGKAVKDLFDDTWYQWVKNGNFAILYGCQEKKADATYHIKGAFQKIRYRFPKIAQLADKQIEIANRTLGIETIPDKTVNPRRGYPIRCSFGSYGKVKPTLPLNYHTSGTAMQWTGKGMIRCDEKLTEWEQSGFDGFITLQVHDEMVFDFPKSKLCPIEENTRVKNGEVISKFAALQSNLWRVRILQKLMEQGGDDIGIPTPVGVELNQYSWDKNVAF